MLRMKYPEWSLTKTSSTMSLMSSSGEDNDDAHSVAAAAHSPGSTRSSHEHGDNNNNNKPPSAMFIHKLYEMACCDTHAHIFGFSEDGMSLKIRNPQAMDQVLTKYFKHGSLSSFIRQLNNYGFKTISSVSGNSVQTFAHPYFSRDAKDLLDTITRKTARHVKKCKADLIKEVQHVETEYRKRFRDLEARNNALQRENEQLKMEIKRLRMHNQDLENRLRNSFELEPVPLAPVNGSHMYGGQLNAIHIDGNNGSGSEMARSNFEEDFELVNMQGANDRQVPEQQDMSSFEALVHNDNGWVCTGNEMLM